jgi:hypothetical protein
MRRSIASTLLLSTLLLSTMLLAIAMTATLVGSALAEYSKPLLTVTYYYLPG